MTLRCSSRSSSLRHQKTRTSWPTRVVAKEIWELRCGVEAENAAQCFNVGLWGWKSRNEKSWVSKDSEDFTCRVVMHFGWFLVVFDLWLLGLPNFWLVKPEMETNAPACTCASCVGSQPNPLNLSRPGFSRAGFKNAKLDQMKGLEGLCKAATSHENHCWGHLIFVAC